MAKYNKQLVKRITNLIKSDYYTVNEICSLSGISESTFHQWKVDKPEFSESIKRAREIRDEKMVIAARRSLFKLIEGYYVENYKTVYENSGKLDLNGEPLRKAKEWTVFKKYYQPSFPAILFVLCNLEKETWKNPFRIEVTGKDGSAITPNSKYVITISGARKALAEMTDEELDKHLAESGLDKIEQAQHKIAKK
jgi:hypothetical protein